MHKETFTKGHSVDVFGNKVFPRNNVLNFLKILKWQSHSENESLFSLLNENAAKNSLQLLKGNYINFNVKLTI